MSWKQVELGRTGLRIPQIGFGAMSLSGMFGPTDEATGHETLAAALETGITFWDTANIYGMGLSEKIIGSFLGGRRPEGLVIATKAGIIPGPPRDVNNSYDYLRRELEGSLERLGLDSVDLFYAHRRHPDSAPEEIAEAMARLIEEGLTTGYGLSEIAPATLTRAHAVHPVTAVQNEYSLWSRQPDLGLRQACTRLGVSFVAFSPLARGMFGETSVDPAGMVPGEFRLENPRFQQPNYAANWAAIDGFRHWAHARGWTVAGAALAWVMAQGEDVIPIPGTRTAAHLREWLDAAEIRLGTQDLAEIETLLPVGFAHGDRYGDSQVAFVERYC